MDVIDYKLYLNQGKSRLSFILKIVLYFKNN